MCGIAGVFSTVSGDAKTNVETVRRMVQLLAHRGPDDQGLWSDQSEGVIFGHCRLAIVDLSPEGHQPMISRCGRYVITFNGEIYNFPELMEELKKINVQFRGHSDTEVLLEGLSQWGLRKTLDKLIGMFAFALWDCVEKKLILARDRAGKKPLYYLKNHGSFYFASELKALETLHDVNLELDYHSLYHYLTFGYIPAPDTIYKNVLKVPASSYLIVDQNLNLRPHLYWEVAWERKRQITFKDAVSEANGLLCDSVKVRLRADVPVGCFLSGGIDSGLLAAISSMQLGRPLKTFTVSFQNGSFDESPLANLVAKQYGTDHHVIALSSNLTDMLPEIVKAYDEPFADPSAIPSYFISREASKYLKVVLNGEGGDELFGGYRRHLAMKLFSRFRGFFKFTPQTFSARLNEILPQPRTFRSKYAFFHRFMRGLTKDPFERYSAWCVDGFVESEKDHLYKTSERNYRPSASLILEKYGQMQYLHPLDHFMAIDFLFNMQNDMLVKMDTATMASSLEARNPFLDHRLIEWAISLPPEIRMKGINTKPILRELAKQYLPKQVVYAPKRGFEIPLISWLQMDLAEVVQDVCLSSNGIISELFDRRYIEGLVSGQNIMDPDRWSKRVWILFMLGMWEKVNK